MSRYSPYQNLRRDAAYPRVFFYTSTKDDRVHPGHARKMAARMQEYGKDFFYYENIDGGHAGVANYKESANLAALMSVYLRLQLGAR
ncbi:prolyl oligopeptidase family serine peptidase [Hankyongella ginsenosidimutans]|uniref:prolyl oligopeptidase family serine peptidase n=1 Tax=Hankyongella ginsenosidimutans TaxID=1763828 RepID=UPI002482FDF3|nr:prolyl oligopeptidase family serine peptidase [Hankyongella ginsenosidimutans]